MAPTSSTDVYDARARAILLDVARASIDHGVAYGRALSVDSAAYDADLCAPRGCFVTLYVDGALRGCVGSLRPRSPLVEEVARNAFAAAFRDPRFSQVTRDEAPKLEIHISVLSPPERVDFEGEADLLRKLRPGIDGVVLREGSQQGTFLPEVWERFDDPRDFLRQLRIKAGLSPTRWSEACEVERYTTEGW